MRWFSKLPVLFIVYGLGSRVVLLTVSKIIDLKG
jgi:hypothetical protein